MHFIPWRLMKYDISFNTINNDFMVEPLRYILSISLAQEIFPAEMENAQITPIYKSGDKESVINYRPIFVLLCFSKTLERIMYDRLYLYLTQNNLLYNKEFGFQKDIPLIMLSFNLKIKYMKCLIKTFTP